MTSRNFPNINIGKLDYPVFEKYLVFFAQTWMAKAGNFKPFVIDQMNERLIKNMYCWLTRHPQGEWNPDKGIYMGGSIGCGKTILMKGFLDCVAAAAHYYIPYIQAPLLFEKIQADGLKSLRLCPLFIDELGREQLEIYVNGVRIRPIEDLMAMRYEYGACTFFTSNFKIETLSQGYDEKGKKIGYGEYIGERFKEMCNIVVYPGSSRR